MCERTRPAPYPSAPFLPSWKGERSSINIVFSLIQFKGRLPMAKSERIKEAAGNASPAAIQLYLLSE